MSMIGEVLRAYCKQQHIEQRQLAILLGIGESTLTRLMNGKTVNQATMVSILSWLFGGEPAHFVLEAGKK